MTDEFLDDLVRRLAAGEDPRHVQRSLVAEPWHRTLQRCAVPRTFDDSLYDTLLNPAEGPGLAEVLDAGFAERVAGAADLYRLRGGVREEWLDTWPARPEERVPHGVVDLSETLADVYAGFEDRLEELYHRAVAEPQRAAGLFADLFTEADRRFDLPGCQDVLDTLSEPARLGWFGDQLAELRADRHAYLRARLFWATEWRQSARYLPRAAVDERLLALTGDAGPRAVEISAPGGMGKTMLLRSFIARECVPDPRRIPCARLDFDLVSPAAAAHRPWLLLLEIADQLNRQMLSSPFQEMLNDHGIFRALLDPMPSAAMRAAAGQLASAERIDADVTSRFARVLAETAGDRPVLIVLDTFEQVLLHPDSDAEKILGAMGRLLTGDESVRLVVAGRYPLSERVPNLPALVPGIERVDIEPFSPDESREYLRRRRGLADDELITAMVAKSRGRPFTLALLADLARDNPGLTAAEVSAYDDPAVLYLVERIVARIDDPAVRWLLRYGVIPRHLGREFVTEVMAPYLRQGMAGRSAVDTPGDDDLPGGVAASLFPTDVLDTPESPLDLDAVWRRLLQYAGESSWVTTFADHPDTVVFHPDLVEPLRRVVRKHRVYTDLHADAARYCAERARAGDDNWLMWTLEEIYHRFQGGRVDEAEGAWRRALAEAYAREDFRARRRIAEEVLRAEYVDESGAPRPFDERSTVVTWPLVARAHFELARAAVGLAERRGLGASDPVLRRGFAELRQIQRIREEHGWAGGPEDEAELARVTATAHRLSDDRSRSLEVAREALSTATGNDRAALQEVVADGIRDLEPERAVRIYRDALNTTEVEPAQRRVWRKLITLLAENDRLAEALRMLGPSARWEGTARGLVVEGRLLLRAGSPAELIVRASRIERDSAPTAEAQAWSLGAARLALHQPFAALDEVRGALKGAETFRNELSELAARIDGELLNVPDAFARVEVVCREWMDAGEAERSWQAAGLPLEFDLRGTATLRNHVEYLLFSAREADRRPGGEGWFRYRLGRIRIATRQGSPEAGSLIDETRAALGPEPAPHRAVDLALVMLPVVPERGTVLLLDGLRRTETAAARLAALSRLRFLPRVQVGARRQGELADLLGPVPPPALEERLPALLTWAEYQRVFGDPAMARVALDRADAVLPAHSTPDSAFRTWLIMDAALRLGQGSVTTPEVDVSALRLAEVAPVLAAAIRILQVLRRPGRAGAPGELLAAGTELANGGGVGSDWEAYLEIARSAVALADGKPESCGKHLTLAERVWDRIHPGVPLPREAALQWQDIPDAEPAPPSPVSANLADWTPRQVVARLTSTYPTIALRFDRPDRDPLTEVRRMAELLAVPPDDPLANQLEALVTELLDHAGRLPARLGDLLADGVLAGRREPPIDLSIATRSSLLGAMPWELATFGRGPERLTDLGHLRSVTRVLDGDLAATHTVALLQRCLRGAGHDLAVDGLYGPDTATALRVFYAGNGLPDKLGPEAWQVLHREAGIHAGQPEVLVVRPSAGLEISHARGGRGRGVDVAALYDRFGFKVTVIHNPGPEDFTTKLRNCVQRGRLAVLHVVGGFGIAGNDVYVEFASAQEVTDLGKWTGPRSSGVLASTTFDRPFAALPQHLPRPLVILDPGRPDANSEAVRQLVLRNAFARHLLELANIPTVLAMGLDRADQGMRRAMIERLAGGSPASELAAELRQWESAEPGEDRGGVVLSTHVPAYAMQRWWTR